MPESDIEKRAWWYFTWWSSRAVRNIPQEWQDSKYDIMTHTYKQHLYAHVITCIQSRYDLLSYGYYFRLPVSLSDSHSLQFLLITRRHRQRLVDLWWFGQHFYAYEYDTKQVALCVNLNWLLDALYTSWTINTLYIVPTFVDNVAVEYTDEIRLTIIDLTVS